MVCSVDKALDLLEEASDLTDDDPLRKGNLLVLPDFGQVIMTGDLHGFAVNFEKVKYFAELDRCPHRHVVLHEIIHSTRNGYDQAEPVEDRSCQLLFDVLEWKLAYPDQVHLIMGNHDLAQITNREIGKSGGPSIAPFNDWVWQQFGTGAVEVLERINDVLMTLPLAIRCPNRIWLSHSLPSPYAMKDFDVTIFTRAVRPNDLLPAGNIYELVWGRNHSAEQLDRLAKLLDVDYFILGHQSQQTGYLCAHDREIVLASDHHEGCMLPIDLGKRYGFDDLVKRILPIHHIPLPENS